jgi:glycolate oxidase
MNASPSAMAATTTERAERQRAVVAALGAVLPPHALLWRAEETLPYECDGLTAYRQTPLVVALPETEAQVGAVLQACHALAVPVVARGSGTGLSGGAMPHAMGVTLALGKFNRILRIDREARTALVQCGVRNLAISEAVASLGLYYAPDPSSQIACSIGGNVAENSGGVHCLKYGLTLHNVLAVRGFTVEGEPVVFGSAALDAPGLDLLPLVVGSEGMLAVITEVTVRLVPRPRLARCIMASFADLRQAGEAVAAIIAAGIIPAGLEMLDRPMARAVEDFVHAGYDLEAAAILLCESDGTPEEVDEEIERMLAVLSGCGATRLEVSRDEAQRLKFWSGRKNAFPASGRISPDYMCMDSTIPRKRLADILGAIAKMEDKYDLRCCNVFHAGDGNLHPLILFDAADPEQLRRAELFGAETQLDVRAVHARGARADGGRQARLRSARHAQPGQGHPHAAALRGVREDAREPGPAAVPGTGALLSMDAALARLVDQVQTARAAKGSLRIVGGASKDFYGGALEGEALDLRPLAGISSYEPSELVVTARGGTLLAELEETLAAKGQCLAFEPPRYTARGTVGGMVAAGLAGPARASAGAVRDHVLGATLLNGIGQVLSFGGQVMKNVAGYDVSRALAGSLGVLGVICEVSLKVLPVAPSSATLRFECDQAEALTRLAHWGGQPLPIHASAWWNGMLVLRLSGARAAVEAACRQLGGEAVDAALAAVFWRGLRDHGDEFFGAAAIAVDQGAALWRLGLPCTAAPLALPGQQLVEWGGAQRWLCTSADAAAVRAAACALGGHATLFRTRDKSPGVFHPLGPALARIQRALKQAFDPDRVFNRGRLYPEL